MNRYIKYTLILLVLLTGLYQKSKAQILQADASLDKPSIMIGDQTQLRFSVRLHTKNQVTFPVLPDSISNKIQVLGSKADTAIDKNDASIETIRKSYTITAFDSGEYVIPSYDFKTANGIVKSAPITLQVQTVAVDTTKGVYDIKQPLVVKYSIIDWLHDNWKLIVIIWLAVMAVAGITYYLVTRFKNKKPVAVQPAKPLVPPHITALKKLDELRGKNLWQQDQTKQYYIELSDVLREYLENRYHITALEQTSEEIFASLRYMDIASENRNLLRQVLILADLVKFAKEKPAPHDNEKSMDNAISFITGTQTLPQAEIKEDNNK